MHGGRGKKEVQVGLLNLFFGHLCVFWEALEQGAWRTGQEGSAGRSAKPFLGTFFCAGVGTWEPLWAGWGALEQGAGGAWQDLVVGVLVLVEGGRGVVVQYGVYFVQLAMHMVL